MCELTVILKDHERTYRQKFLCYNEFMMSPTEPYIHTCIEEAKKNFQGQPEDVTIKISMEM